MIIEHNAVFKIKSGQRRGSKRLLAPQALTR